MNIKGEVLTNVATAKKKTPRRKTMSKAKVQEVLFSVAAACEARKVSPAEVILDAIQSSEVNIKERADYAKVLLEYVEPKRRAVEHSGSIEMSLPELLAQAEQEWHDRRGH